MKLLISYETKERKYNSPNTYCHVSKEIELDAVRIIRYPCGSGEAANRYYYEAEFVAPDDAEFTYNGNISVNINRKKNKGFKPKDFKWNGRIAVI